MNRSLLRELRILLRPLALRISSLAARAVVQRVSDAPTLQGLQIGVLAGESVDDAEHFQPFGLSAVPLVGAEAVVIFPNGDRGHPLVVAVDDRRYRPTGQAPGTVTIYNHSGAYVRIQADGDIELTPATGRRIYLGSASASDPVALSSEVTALKSATATALSGIASGAGTPVSEVPTPGATKVRAE